MYIKVFVFTFLLISVERRLKKDRQGKTFDHALIEITEKVRKALDSGKFACGIFVDLQKAFDTVNHNILLNKLEHYGLCGTSKS